MPDDEYEAFCADYLEHQILHEGPDLVAAFIAEPVMQANGVQPPSANYFRRVREICDKYGVLLIVDEVITGFGRTGAWFASEHYGIEPDIMTMAKAMTAGYFPMGAMIARKELVEALPVFRHVHTFDQVRSAGRPAPSLLDDAASQRVRVNRRSFLSALAGSLLAAPLVVEGQPAGKIPRVGYLAANPPSANAERIEAFRQGLLELGYVERKNIIIEWRSAEGIPGHLPALAAELVRLKVDVIVTGGSSTTRAAKDATATIPIVMAQDGDPVGNGFVASLARPGGNITGLSSLFSELAGKRLGILKESIPRLSRVAVLGTSANPANALQLRETELAAGVLGVKIHYLDVLDPKDIETAFTAASNAHVDAVLVLVSVVFNSERKQIADLAAKHRLPAMYGQQEFVTVGGLMTYNVSTADLWRRSATYVDRILKGRKPADLPVEQPTKFEFVVNLKAAKQIGLTIPPALLQRADQVIE